MDYKIIEIETSNGLQRHVVITLGNNSFESFPMDEDNPRYQQWLAEGNTPEPWNPGE